MGAEMKIKGIISAMVTPLDGEEKLNEKELKRQVDRQVEAGVAAVFCLGTNGEFYAFSEDEKKRVIDATVKAAAGRVPVFAGTGCITTRETIALTDYAAKAGAFAVSVISPYFAGIDQKGLYRHFITVAEHSQIPIILYNIPARTGVNIDYRTVVRLQEHPNIVGIKDSSGNFLNTLRYIEETNEDFTVLCGNDALILWTLAAGGDGGISGLTNILPETMVGIYQNFAAGNWEEARRLQKSINRIRDCFGGYNPNSVVKLATRLEGFPVGNVKAPFAIEDTELERKLLGILKEMGLK